MSRLVSSVLLVLVVLTCLWSACDGQSAAQSDYNTLQFALTLENMESTFYSLALTNYSSYLSSPLFPPSFASFIALVSSHEMQHVQLLTATINGISPNTAVRPCVYNFTAAFASPLTFAATAQALENTGQSAYDGAINSLTNTTLQTIAAQIATIEARQAAYLNIINAANPFPLAFDIARNGSTVAGIAAQFFVSCPYNISTYLPMVRPGGVAIVNGAVVQTGNSGTGVYTQAQQNNDIITLNYALTLENFEAAFYAYGNNTFSASQFAAAGYSSLFYTYVQAAAGQEALHASTLQSVINGRVANAAVPLCSYNFTSITTVQQFVAAAFSIESLGVTAYDGVINTLVDTNLQQFAATIGTVEARHASFLGNYTGQPFTASAFDVANAPTTVLTLVQSTGYLVSCPYTIQTPVVNATVVVPLPTYGGSTGGAASSSTGSATTGGGISPAQGDYNTLQFALTLEHMESTFYNLGVSMYNQTFFSAAGFPDTFYSYLQTIASQEAQHVVFLTNTINSIQPGTAVTPCTYNFTIGFASASAFVSLSSAFENTGQSAYDGAINSLTNTTYQQVAATIATVEARHAAYLNQLLNNSPFPYAFDIARNGSTVAGIASNFILACSYNISTYIPQIRPGGVALVNGEVQQTSNTPNGVYTLAQQDNDLVALNYALTLENFESAFYTYGVNTFSTAQYIAAGYPAYVQQYVAMIASQENTHAITLTTTVNGRVPNAAVPACSYNFASITNVQSFLIYAVAIEGVGVSAYDGAVNTIVDTNLQQIAATIATVEARHAAFLQNITGSSPFPQTFDNATSPALAWAQVQGTGFLTSCPYTLQLPVVGATATVPIPTFGSSSSSTGNAAASSFASTPQLISTVLVLALASVSMLIL